MRTNTQALMSDPRFSIADTLSGKWAFFKTQTPREMHAAAVQYARTLNERHWLEPQWIGLGEQSIEAFDTTGIAVAPRDAMQKATATLVRKPSKAGKSAPSIVGGAWATPAVLAGLPMAAIARQRTKKPPVRIDLICSWSSSVNSGLLLTRFAKLARAIWDYTLAGGSVTLTVHSISKCQSAENGITRFCASTRVPTQDIAQLSLALSPVLMRACTFPLGAAYSTATTDRLTVPSDRPMANAIFIGGRTRSGDIGSNLDDVLKTLQVF